MSDPRFGRRWWTRRGFLQAGAAAAGVWGLGGRLGHTAEIPSEFDGSKFQLAAPEPNPKRGGVMRYGITMRPPHFDMHQSGTINSLGAQGCSPYGRSAQVLGPVEPDHLRGAHAGPNGTRTPRSQP